MTGAVMSVAAPIMSLSSRSLEKPLEASEESGNKSNSPGAIGVGIYLISREFEGRIAPSSRDNSISQIDSELRESSRIDAHVNC